MQVFSGLAGVVIADIHAVLLFVVMLKASIRRAGVFLLHSIPCSKKYMMLMGIIDKTN
jgi:hypothetical protein